MSARTIHGRGHCACGQVDPELDASEVTALLQARCCGALYLDRGAFVSLLRDWRVPMVEEYDQAAQARRSEAAWERIGEGGAA